MLHVRLSHLVLTCLDGDAGVKVMLMCRPALQRTPSILQGRLFQPVTKAESCYQTAPALAGTPHRS